MTEKILWWVGVFFLVQSIVNGFAHVLRETAEWGRAFPKAAEPPLYTTTPEIKVSPAALMIAVVARTLFAVWLFWLAYRMLWGK